MSLPMRYRQLGKTGMRLSIISLGGSGYGNVYGDHNDAVAKKSLDHAIFERGINYIDTAYWYGQGTSEQFLGRALKDIPKSKYFIATKVGRYEVDLRKRFDFRAETVTKSAEESLKRLQMSEVDLLQVHDVEFASSVDMIVNETLPAVQRLKERGLCRFIGITGYPLEPMREIIAKSKVKIDSVLSYARLSLNDSTLVNHFDFFKSHQIPLINACAVSMGLLTPRGHLDWHPAGEEIKKACSAAVRYCSEQGVDITRLAHNYATNFEEVTTTLVSMSDTVMVDTNVDAVLRPLTEKEREVQEEIERRFFKPLPQKHWEGVELREYWQAMKQDT